MGDEGGAGPEPIAFVANEGHVGPEGEVPVLTIVEKRISGDGYVVAWVSGVETDAVFDAVAGSVFEEDRRDVVAVSRPSGGGFHLDSACFSDQTVDMNAVTGADGLSIPLESDLELGGIDRYAEKDGKNNKTCKHHDWKEKAEI